MTLINLPIVHFVICVTIPFTCDHYSLCYEGQKGVKSRKGLSWDFWQSFIFSLKAVHFPMHARNKTREVAIVLEEM